MTFFNNLDFVLAMLFQALVYYIVSVKSRGTQQTCIAKMTLLSMSLISIYLYSGMNALNISCLIIFCVIYYYSCTFRAARPVALALIFWFFAKAPTAWGLHNHFIHILGASFILCRLVSFAIELRNKNISGSNLMQFLLYVLYFPTLMSGPITKYSDFGVNQTQVIKNIKKYYIEYFVPGSKRVALGIVKKYILAEILSATAISNSNIATASSVKILICFYCSYFYLYFDFSGYVDMAVGLSMWFEIKLPENFNWPILARNVSEFWRRWHITLSSWLYRYIFYPLLPRLLRSLSWLNRFWLAPIAIFITFMLAGLWHGLDGRYLRAGLVHSISLFIFFTFDDVLRKHFRTIRDRILSSTTVRMVSTGLTFHCICLALFLSTLDTRQTSDLIHRLLHGPS